MSYNEKARLAIYKWRESHRLQHNVYLLKKNSEYKLLNKDHINELRRKLYAYKKEAKSFRNILMI